MTRSQFIGRRREIDLLDQLWHSSRAELLILYGRRRVGKTRLLTHWMASTAHRALYWVAAPTSAHDQLRSFSQAVYNFINPESPAPDDFSYASWEQAFQPLRQMARTQRLVLVLDEFTYVLAVSAGIAGVLQNMWDHQLQETQLVLVIAGSHIGMLERDLLAYQAPLYGRATALLKLLPLSFADSRPFFPNYSPEERVAVYAMLGGIPAYWERFNPGLSVDQNIRQEFLEGNRLLQDEPRLLLHDFVADGHNYITVLQALAHGYRTPTEIGGYVGLEATHVSPYLARLVESGFVEKRLPITAAAGSRQGRHHITDPFLRFYYRFLSQRQAQLALGVQTQALKEIKRHLLDFIGSHTWEELAREWLLRAAGQGGLPFTPDQVGSAWTRQSQLDVVGVNFMEKTLLLGECKWSPKPIGEAVLAGLVEKTASVVPTQGKWRVSYVGFARGGWTAGAKAYAAALNQQARLGDNWTAQGLQLLDLTQLDRDLADWS